MTSVEIPDSLGRFKRCRLTGVGNMAASQAELFDMNGTFNADLQKKFGQAVHGAVEELLNELKTPFVADWLDPNERILVTAPSGPTQAADPVTVLQDELAKRLVDDPVVRKAMGDVGIDSINLNARTTQEIRNPDERQMQAISP